MRIATVGWQIESRRVLEINRRPCYNLLVRKAEKRLRYISEVKNMILADKIIKLRKKSGMSQEELAERMGVSRQAVSKWESAQSIPDLDKILMLSSLFSNFNQQILQHYDCSSCFWNSKESARFHLCWFSFWIRIYSLVFKAQDNICVIFRKICYNGYIEVIFWILGFWKNGRNF